MTAAAAVGDSFTVTNGCCRLQVIGLLLSLLWACPATAGSVTCTTCDPAELPLLLLLQLAPPVCQYKLEVFQCLQLPHGPVALQLQVQNPAVADSCVCQNLDAHT
jgi:hypothetical protein